MRPLGKSILSYLLALTTVFSAEVYCSDQLAPAERLVRVLSGIQTLHAEFAHEAAHEAASSETQTGEIWLSKPGLFRVETGAPLSQTIVSNGVSMWTHDRDLEQVIISPLNTRVDEMPILLFSGAPDLIPKSYSIEFFGDEHRRHFRLTPIDSTNLITMLILTFEDDLPASISVENAAGERRTIKLTNVSDRVNVNEQTFTFQVPEFADVIDDRPG
ncbi:MAG: outer-membrane lipoprotein carrier protein LolA [Candidatus Azotimanducaceae bacterium WSBS_2022_MAG_OTU7]